MNTNHTVAVLIPCYNEEITIGKVVNDFKTTLPAATIYVYDNNSTDATKQMAAEAGAIVRSESQQGKGNVIRRMFADIDADCYVLVDGDDTYDVAAAPQLIRKLQAEQLDMVVGVRKTREGASAYPAGHTFGNMAFNKLFSSIFSNQFSDIFSGYRCFSRRFVKSFPSLSSGFEIETEISTHAINLKLPTAEIHTAYGERPQGSHSKLNTYCDGCRILWTIARLYKDLFPARFFGLLAILGLTLSLFLGIPIIYEFIETGLVPKFPTAILASGIMILSGISLICGLILDNVTRGRLEQKRLWYLSLSRDSKAP